jgi:hypothetical protein
MLSLLSKLQRKSERERKKIAIVASGVVTGVIVVMWLISLSFRDLPAVVTDESSGRPFESLGAGIGSILDETRQAIQEVKDVFSTESEKTTVFPEATGEEEL